MAAAFGGHGHIINRKLPGRTTFNFVGVSGKKEFVDISLFAGPDSVRRPAIGRFHTY